MVSMGEGSVCRLRCKMVSNAENMFYVAHPARIQAQKKKTVLVISLSMRPREALII